MRWTRVCPVVLAACAVVGPATASDRVAANGGDIVISPLLHASVQLEFAGTVIQVDPWSRGDLSSARKADLILITDDVGHHLDLEAIAQLRKPGTVIVIPAAARSKIPDGIVLPNGERTVAASVAIESIAAYDIKPGAPEHPKGDANGYVVTLGGKRIYLAGVTECVPEVKALSRIDVAFIPMLLPLERMQPADAAACVKSLMPTIVYPYHYDQAYATRLTNPRAPASDRAAIAAALTAFRDALAGAPIEVRTGHFYPPFLPNELAPPARAPASAAADQLPAPVVDNDRVTVWLDDGRIPAAAGALDTVRVLLTGTIGKAVFQRGADAARPAAAQDKSILIRLKPGAVPPLKNTSGSPLAFPRPGSTQLLDNNRVVIWDYTWTPGVATPTHFHDKDVVVIYLAEGALTSTTPDGASVVNPHSFGFTKFNNRDRVHTETLTRGSARAIIVELK